MHTSIWKKPVDIEELNKRFRPKLIQSLGIHFTTAGDTFLEATMPVDSRTTQPFGVLHGGASCALAETVGSMASYLCIDGESSVPMGMTISASHLKPVDANYVTARATPQHLGGSSHVWTIELRDVRDVLICFIIFTVAIRPRPVP